jgi:transposase
MDRMSGRRISPLVAAALCIKPRRQMTVRQIVNVDALKAASAEFTTMRGLAMRIRGLLRGGAVEKLVVWLKDARRSGIYGMQRFARALRHDIEAVRNAVLEPWSNGQTEGQINRLNPSIPTLNLNDVERIDHWPAFVVTANDSLPIEEMKTVPNMRVL